MMIRRLTDQGRDVYRAWLEQRSQGEAPPIELLNSEELTEAAFDLDIDQSKTFSSRYEFGEYLNQLLTAQDPRALLSSKNDGLWDWLTIAYFHQIGKKMSRPWHYTVIRQGHSGTLAYRHLVRTTFEMYWRHGKSSMVMLLSDMATWGDLSEQLTSRQNVAHHRVYIQAANALYLRDGKVVRGAASRVKPLKKRKPGETRGRGGVARLAVAVRRLDRTYDTRALTTADMLKVLPREFQHFSSGIPQ
jgi:hypothetical protein